MISFKKLKTDGSVALITALNLDGYNLQIEKNKIESRTFPINSGIAL